MQKPLPDFSSPEWERSSPRSKLMTFREFVLNHEGPIPQSDVRRMMAAMFKLSIDLVAESHMSSKYAMDQVEVTRMLHVEIAMFERT